MLSRDKRLPLDTWRCDIGITGNFFWCSGLLRLTSARYHQGIHHCAPQRDTRISFGKQQGRRHLSQEMTNLIDGRIPMPTFARRPSTVSSTIPVVFLQNSMVGPQRQQIWESSIRQIPQPTIVLDVENKIQNTVFKWFWHSVGSYVMDERSGAWLILWTN